MKIGVLTGADEKQKNLLDISLPILDQYCQKHNYYLHYFTSNVDNSNQILDKSYFARYPFIKKHLPNYDWVFWIDADCLVMNFFRKLEYYIDNNYSIILDKSLTEKHPSCQSGHGFWKNDSNSIDILNRVIEKSKEAKPGFADNEILNSIFTSLYSKKPFDFHKLIKLLGPGKTRIGHYDKEIIEFTIFQQQGFPEGEFSLYPFEGLCTFDDIYIPGRDFLYHRAGVDILQKRVHDDNEPKRRDFANKESDLKYHADRIIREKIVTDPKIDKDNWAYTVLEPK